MNNIMKHVVLLLSLLLVVDARVTTRTKVVTSYRTLVRTKTIASNVTKSVSVFTTVTSLSTFTQVSIQSQISVLTTWKECSGTSLAVATTTSTISTTTTFTATAPLVMVGFGDAGVMTATQTQVAQQMSNWTTGRPLDAILVMGDNVYPDGRPEYFDAALTQPYKDLTMRAPLIACLGNHDYQTNSGLNQLSYLNLPGKYYEKVVWRGGKSVQILVLDSNDVSAAQTNWLTSRLAVSFDKRIAIFHHPIWSCGGHGSTSALQGWNSQLKGNVNLVLNGHDHNYQRFVDGGTTYIVTGGGGAGTYTLTSCPVGTPSPVFSAVRHHFIGLTIDDKIRIDVIARTMSFVKRVAVTYGTFVAANFLSNYLLFPGKKLDYGACNRLVGRPVNNEFWGTRLQHVSLIALPLAFFDHLSLDIWNKFLLPRMGIKGPVSWTGTPTVFMLHSLVFVMAGIMSYIAHDAYTNPLHEGKDRWELVKAKFYPELSGTVTMWSLGASGQILSHLVGKPTPHGTLLGLIPPTLAFTTVKGFSMSWPWRDNLTPFEKDVLNAPAGSKLAIPA